MKRILFLIILWIAALSSSAIAQTLYIPGSIGASHYADKVGIGTDEPKSTLEVRVAGNNTSVQTALTILQTNPASPNNGAGVSLDFGIGNNVHNNHVQGKITLKETEWGYKPKMFFSLWDPTYTMRDRMVIDTYGRVGIGTIDPEYNLHIDGGTGGTSMTLGSIHPYGHTGLILSTEGETGKTSIQSWRAEIDYGTISLNPIGGNVGIGTTSPDAKLTVKGSIHAEEVKVDLNVPAPDYVFEEDYKLTSLNELEIYVKQNKHLPEVPSAKQMEEEGMKLKEMNLLLLKKVEELTLYVIELKKEVEQIKNK